ncbi:GCN5 family acetyltransferase [Marinomonas ushuaiensis DSM 15871]|uniref:GCN5 family acetyltransferase n=1 Tax=Marinomonas ushuaiensis DSM 15871 TaxID=1122207 RepID=X7E766_9GAMM|nr:bifunctional helix-turn-helix transcriptional regulator/GNAT family N-acetyltransferase [Marinomonas ushuaiensis]ETX11720.1 GCN5 family acetyltransferase [Marinomonas ushuaiensis DSM 15871]
MEQFGVLTLGSRLKRLSDYLFAEVQEIYLQCDVPISSTYFPILKLLQKMGSLSVMEIAESLHLSHPAVSKQTAKMLKEYLLDKNADEDDQRRSLLSLSEKGLAAMLKVEPVLEEMKVVIEQFTDFSSDNFMAGLEALEKQVFSEGLANKVLDRLLPFKIIELSRHHEKSFYNLNMAWLERYFPNQISEHDLALLERPLEYVAQHGGTVWVAIREANQQNVALGTIVLAQHGDGQTAEILKLSVAEHCQGKGIAQALLSHVFETAQSVGMTKLTLETASCLTAARHLYDKNGFIEMLPPKPSLYERADVYMEKSLEKPLRLIKRKQSI